MYNWDKKNTLTDKYSFMKYIIYLWSSVLFMSGAPSASLDMTLTAKWEIKLMLKQLTVFNQI